jgi:hypothetical protein
MAHKYPTVKELDRLVECLSAEVKEIKAALKPEWTWRTELIMRVTRIEQAIECMRVDSEAREVIARNDPLPIARTQTDV